MKNLVETVLVVRRDILAAVDTALPSALGRILGM
jgi:hypothetical protein